MVINEFDAATLICASIIAVFQTVSESEESAIKGAVTDVLAYD